MTRARRRLPLLLRSSFVVAVMLCAATRTEIAFAQPLDKDADAERLFREGQKLLEERRYGEACPKFEAAYRKDQQLGTLLNLAYCHKEQGAIWLAWVEFKEAEVKAIELKRSDRKEFAKQRMTELEKQLAKGIVEVQQRVDLTEVLVEDRRVPEAEKGQTFAIEPGQRKFTFRAKGKKQVVQLVTVVKSSQPQRITVPEMEDQPKEAPPIEPPPTKVEKTPPPPPPPPDKASGGMSTQKIVGFVAIGVGVVGGGGLGTIFGLKALNDPCADGQTLKENRAKGLPDPPACTEGGRSDASSTTVISTVSFAAGAVLAVGGLILVLTAPSGKDAASSSSTVGGGPGAARARLKVVPEIGAGWAGLRGVF